MKLKACAFLVGLAMAALCAGCAFTPIAPPRGIMYSSQSAPLFPASETGSLKGEASAHNVMFFVGWGDCSLKAAMQDGGIRKVKNVDYKLVNYFIFYQRFTVIAYGESEPPSPSKNAKAD